MKIAAPRKKIPAAVRAAVFEASQGVCALCPHVFVPGQTWHADHIIEHALDGTDEATNLRALCVPCHKKRTAERAPALAKVARLIRKADPVTRKKPTMRSRPTKWPSRAMQSRPFRSRP